MRIGIDLMGSDHSPLYLYSAVSQIAELYAHVSKPSLQMALLVTPEISQQLPELPDCVELICAPQVVEMTDPPAASVRSKPDSSMMRGVKLVREGALDALVTTGNTGALIAASTLLLKRMPGIGRPPLLATLPTDSGGVAVVDVGGNVACRPDHMLQFALLGSAYTRCMRGTDRPRVGLLNVGIEPTKGTTGVREVYESLGRALAERSDSLDFVGNVEGHEVYAGQVDVLVTDGFTGNVFLKASEGVSSFILNYLNAAFEKREDEEVSSVMEALARHVDYAEYPGAAVCGVEGLIVKCHGYSDVRALRSGILGAIRLVEQDFISKLRRELLSL